MSACSCATWLTVCDCGKEKGYTLYSRRRHWTIQKFNRWKDTALLGCCRSVVVCVCVRENVCHFAWKVKKWHHREFLVQAVAYTISRNAFVLWLWFARVLVEIATKNRKRIDEVLCRWAGKVLDCALKYTATHQDALKIDITTRCVWKEK